MSGAFNVVRFQVKSGMEDAFLDAHRDIAKMWPGMVHANIIRIGERRYCIIAEWESMDALAACRSQMIATLNSFRETLEDLGRHMSFSAVAAAGPGLRHKTVARTCLCAAG